MRLIKRVLLRSGEGDVDRHLLHLLSVPLLEAALGGGVPPQRIGAISISIALLEPQLSARYGSASYTRTGRLWVSASAVRCSAEWIVRKIASTSCGLLRHLDSYESKLNPHCINCSDAAQGVGAAAARAGAGGAPDPGRRLGAARRAPVAGAALRARGVAAANLGDPPAAQWLGGRCCGVRLGCRVSVAAHAGAANRAAGRVVHAHAQQRQRIRRHGGSHAAHCTCSSYQKQGMLLLLWKQQAGCPSSLGLASGRGHAHQHRKLQV